MTSSPRIESPGQARRGAAAGLIVLALLSVAAAPGENDPFTRFQVPPDWQARFWGSEGARALLKLSPKQVADLVPVQAGVRYCRCPACDADEADNPMVWSAAKPKELRCRACGVVVPNDKFPAKDDKKNVPEETVEVRPGVIHHYPYHPVEAPRQRLPDERLYLAAKIDYEAREFLAKTALYAALKYRDQPAGKKDQALAKTACVILVRFAQVYPSYSIHYDQPNALKHFDRADLPPPYQKGYRAAKWDWSGSLDVPLNLVVAHALLRHDGAMAQAGQLLKVPDPNRLIERDLFRASAEFVRRQPEAFNESALQADRGILAVGRLLGDPVLVADAVGRLERLAERGFYHDGFWRQGTLAAHRRVLGQLDGWFGRLLEDQPSPGAAASRAPAVRADVPMLALAETAGAAVLADPPAAEVQRVSLSPTGPLAGHRGPVLLGGTGLARLALGQGADALDLELRSLDAFGPERIVRQALRVGVAGRPVIDDLDDRDPLASGYSRASVSHNTVVVDGLNHRESHARAHQPAAGGNFLFFAADLDFQAVTLDDVRAYPDSLTRYRQTLLAVAAPRSRFAVGIFEVHGGFQHDQIVHGPVGSAGRWALSVPSGRAPETLLPAGLTYVPTARADDGRWFLQAYGELAPVARGAIDRPATAQVVAPPTAGASAGVGIRLHLLGDMPMLATTAVGPDTTAPTRRTAGDDPGQAVLVLRRRMLDGSSLRSTFVTVYEPVAPGLAPLKRVGRVGAGPGPIVLYVETVDGPEQLVVNLTPGTLIKTTLADGKPVTTDGLALRLSPRGLALAGGTFAEVADRRVEQHIAGGRIVASKRSPSAGSRGWFESDHPLADPASLAGRVMLIRHADGTTRGWTLRDVENTPTGARLHVREEPGFQLDPTTGTAHYYQFPQAIAPGPHDFRVGKIARTGAL